jgi:hypothetical protein
MYAWSFGFSRKLLRELEILVQRKNRLEKANGFGPRRSKHSEPDLFRPFEFLGLNHPDFRAITLAKINRHLGAVGRPPAVSLTCSRQQTYNAVL